MRVIFDLDSALGYGRGEARPAMIGTLLALRAAGAVVQVWSARSDRAAARAWLDGHGLAGVLLRTRRAGDARSDFALKAAWIEADVCAGLPDMAFESRAEVVEV